jgi:serine/threonine protein phosphatase PrpC
MLSFHCAQQACPYMEDKSFAIDFEESFCHHAGLFGVLDGHGGDAVAKFVRDCFATKFQQTALLCLSGQAEALVPHYAACARLGYTSSTRLALCSTVLQLEDSMALDQRPLQRQISAQQGAVGAFVFLNHPSGVPIRRAYVCNVGDTEVVLARGRKAELLSQKHVASDAAEAALVRGRGGFITSTGGVARVNGDLMPSRSFGDFRVKPFVSADPFITGLDLTADCAFLILASDGLWDHLTYQQAVDVVYSVVVTAGTSRRHAAEALVAASAEVARKAKAAQDNISVMVLFLKGESLS